MENTSVTELKSLLVIQRNVPQPLTRQRGALSSQLRLFLETLIVGDSVFVPETVSEQKKTNARTAAINRTRRESGRPQERQLISRWVTEGGTRGVRVWCVRTGDMPT